MRSVFSSVPSTKNSIRSIPPASEAAASQVGSSSVPDTVWPAVGFVQLTVGGVVSPAAWMVQLALAGVASALPAASVARTSAVWAPRASPVQVFGLVHALQLPPSMRHWKLAPASEVKVSVAEVELVVPDGPEPIVVSGAVVSTVHVRVAAAPVLPAASVARTSKVWPPSARPV